MSINNPSLTPTAGSRTVETIVMLSPGSDVTLLLLHWDDVVPEKEQVVRGTKCAIARLTKPNSGYTKVGTCERFHSSSHLHTSFIHLAQSLLVARDTTSEDQSGRIGFRKPLVAAHRGEEQLSYDALRFLDILPLRVLP